MKMRSQVLKRIASSILVLDIVRRLVYQTLTLSYTKAHYEIYSGDDNDGIRGRRRQAHRENESSTLYSDTYRYKASPKAAVRTSSTLLPCRHYQASPCQPYESQALTAQFDYRRGSHIYPTNICGSKPLFSSFFSQTSDYRSYLNEDKIIYETFFKEHIASDVTFKGTYVELGAFDGMRYSNTRFFDQCLGWEGLLIEGDPKMYDTLNINRPNAHQMNFAPLCEKTAGETIQVSPAASANMRLKSDDKAHLNVNIPCGPLGPVLEDVFVDHDMHINFFALDMEGLEDVVLNTIDFEKVQIDVLMVGLENNDCSQYGKCKVRDNVRSTLEEAGYTRHDRVLFSESLDVYVHGKSQFRIDTAEIDHPVRYHNLPNIQMIGVRWAGTTAISEWLYGQPISSPSRVCRPTVFEGEPSFFRKEVHFFDLPDRFSQGIEFYAKRFESCEKHRFAMDATPDTFRHPKHLHDVYHQAGGRQHDELKIILILRDPPSRQLSFYNRMLVEHLKEPSGGNWYNIIASDNGLPMSFEDYVGKFLVPEVTSMKESNMNFYPNNLVEWTDYFARDQILVLSYDEVRLKPESAQDRIRNFLGSDFPGELPVSRVNKSPSKVHIMDCKTRNLLKKLYRPQTKRLYKYLTDNPGPDMEQRPFNSLMKAPCK